MMTYSSPGGHNAGAYIERAITMIIRNYRNVKVAYEIIRICREFTPPPGEEARLEEQLVDVKRSVRAFLREQRGQNEDRRIIKDEGMDGFVELVRLPAFLRTLDDAKEYFEEHEVRECAPSMYDCTGQAFTSWYKVFERRGRLWAYHRIAFDV